MAMTVNPLTSYLLFNILGEWRTVSIISVRNSGNLPAVSCTKAIRGKVPFKVLMRLSAAMVDPGAMYSIPIDLAPGPWKPGDTLTDATQVDATSQTTPGVTYTILQADMDEAFWLLHCINPKLSYHLQDTGSIYEGTRSITGIGTTTVSTAALYANIACRIQPSVSSWAMQHNRVGDNKTFDVFIAADYDLQPSKHMFVWTSGANTYEADIVDVTSRESIVDLMKLTVTLRVGATGTT